MTMGELFQNPVFVNAYLAYSNNINANMQQQQQQHPNPIAQMNRQPRPMMMRPKRPQNSCIQSITSIGYHNGHPHQTTTRGTRAT